MSPKKQLFIDFSTPLLLSNDSIEAEDDFMGDE